MVFGAFLSSEQDIEEKKKNKNRDFQYPLCHQTNIASPIISIPNYSGIFVIIEEPISTHHNHLKTAAITLGRVYSMDLEK